MSLLAGIKLSARVKSEVESLKTLERVLNWAFAQKPPAEIVAIVTQDEFTHDVVLKIDAVSYLVFDTT